MKTSYAIYRLVYYVYYDNFSETLSIMMERVKNTYDGLIFNKSKKNRISIEDINHKNEQERHIKKVEGSLKYTTRIDCIIIIHQI